MTAAAAAPLVAVDAVTKRFPGVVANDAVSLELHRGEIHALLGENGSGKSTLIGMLGGQQRPDAGEIRIDGAPARLHAPAAAIAAGIGVVPQHSTLVETMTVLENLLLGDRGSFRLRRADATAKLERLAASIGARLDPGARVGALSLGERQQLDIVQALWHDPRLLVLDEPTSMLAPDAVERLLGTLEALAGAGLAVLLVTHKLREAARVARAVTVLRRGRVTARLAAPELAGDADAIAARLTPAMFGEGGTAPAPAAAPVGTAEARITARRGEVVLELDGVATAAPRGAHDGTPVRAITLALHAGELVGVAGIDGHGQRHLAEAIAGQRPAVGGRIVLDGRDLQRASVRDRQRAGLRTVTDDRLHEGIVGGMSVALNLVLTRIGQRPFWRRGIIDRDAVAASARRQIADYDVRPDNPAARAGSLSGGNIQKLLLARALTGEARALVVSKPSTGLDLRTVARVHGLLRGFADDGGTALVISPDLDELLDVCDRIAVLSQGRIVDVVDNAGDRARTAARLAELISGGAS